MFLFIYTIVYAVIEKSFWFFYKTLQDHIIFKILDYREVLFCFIIVATTQGGHERYEKHCTFDMIMGKGEGGRYEKHCTPHIATLMLESSVDPDSWLTSRFPFQNGQNTFNFRTEDETHTFYRSPNYPKKSTR